MQVSLGSVFFSLLLSSASVFAQYAFERADRSCDGFPLVTVGTFEGSCLGMVTDTSVKDEKTGEGLRFPRKIVELEPGRLIVSDMGGWSPPNRGSLWELDLRQNQKKLIKLIGGLYLPHDLDWGPDGNLYVGELGKIVRYQRNDLLNRASLKGDVVVGDIPTNLNSPNMHPLVNFTFGEGEQDKWNLYVNVGAPTDACTKEAPYKCKTAEQQGVIRHYSFQSGLNRWNPQYEILATGLRNSMGLVSHPSGLLLQVENSRDFKESGEPYDEINVIQKSKNYGWPYCYNFQAVSPEWKGHVQCDKGYEPPLLLLPPHSAPLDILYYRGSLFPELQNQVLISLHGYQPSGSRVLAFPVNESGQIKFENAGSWEYSAGNKKTRANPAGGNLRAADFTEVISSWWKRDGIRPTGAPVGMTVASDGSIFIIEDKNKTILRLSKSNSGKIVEDANQEERDKAARADRILKKVTEDARFLEAYNWINQNVIQSSCTACHSQLAGSKTEALEFMVRESWIIPGLPSQSLLMKRLRGLEGLQKMPLGSPELPAEHINYIESFVKAL